MDYDSFLGSQRWVILEIIARQPSSPVKISQQINTSVSYVSQQLKLLEAAGLVVKERTGSAEKGKPRLVYSIAREILQLSGLLKGLPVKKHVSLDAHKKVVLRIWALEDEGLHSSLERVYWRLEENLKDVGGIFVDLSKSEVLVISDSKKVRSDVEKIDGLKIRFVSESELKKVENLYVIYNPNLLEGKQLKA
ncbi:MAG: winged helix-turn-helix domain-containing protein [Nanoarchaeota archaeon]|nr:winged helix-turn-helix domain-containing protein [Nanoarchaeota archaeon]